MRLRSKRTVMGVIWPFCAPLFLFGLYRYVFGSVFRVPVEHYGVYLFCGLLPWTFLVQAVHDSLQSISFEPDLVRRAPFPHHFLPLSRVVVMSVPFVSLLVLFAGVVSFAGGSDVDPLLLPVLVVPVVSMVALVAGLSLLLSLVDVFNRDLRYVLHNLLTVWFFLVPIVYHPRMAGGRIQTILEVDPMRHVVGQFRDVLYDGAIDDPLGHALTFVACRAFFAVALAVFRRGAVDLAKDV